MSPVYLLCPKCGKEPTLEVANDSNGNRCFTLKCFNCGFIQGALDASQIKCQFTGEINYGLPELKVPNCPNCGKQAEIESKIESDLKQIWRLRCCHCGFNSGSLEERPRNETFCKSPTTKSNPN